jgi:hypothetical protein
MTVSGLLSIAGGQLGCSDGTQNFKGGIKVGGNTGASNSSVDGSFLTGGAIVNVTDVTILGSDSNSVGRGKIDGDLNISGNWVSRQGSSNSAHYSGFAIFTAASGTQTIDSNSTDGTMRINHPGAGTLAVINSPLGGGSSVASLANAAGMFVVNAPATATFSNSMTLQQPANGVCIVDANDSVITASSITMTGGILRSGTAGVVKLNGGGGGDTIVANIGAGNVQPVIQCPIQLGNVTHGITVNSNCDLRYRAQSAALGRFIQPADHF